MTTQEFARYHGIPLEYALAHEQGCEAARRNEDYRYPITPSPEQGWFFAGYQDTLNEMNEAHYES